MDFFAESLVEDIESSKDASFYLLTPMELILIQTAAYCIYVYSNDNSLKSIFEKSYNYKFCVVYKQPTNSRGAIG